ncbi:MAG TPA: PCRF domain-containing protein, partial [Spirochaetales bacterium]|nr:PCRF domain-containing protein [Spirochaetales bacterium]
MIDRLEAAAARYAQLTELVSSPDLARDAARYKDTMRERSRLETLVSSYQEYRRLLDELEGAKAMVDGEADGELRDLAREELAGLEGRRDGLEEKLRLLLVPHDPLDDKNTI